MSSNESDSDDVQSPSETTLTEQPPTRERPLSIERRASMFNKLFKPSVDRMFVPVAIEACEAFEVRKGAFAALGRCARCNFRENEHKTAKAAVMSLEEVKTRQHQHRSIAFNTTLLPVKENDPVVKKTGVVIQAEITAKEKQVPNPATENEVVSSDKTEPPVAEKATPPSEDQQQPVVTEHIKQEEYADDVDADEFVEDEDIDEDGSRPSWAPPPLIDVTSGSIDDVNPADDSNSAGMNSPPRPSQDSPVKRRSSLSWLNPRTASSSSGASSGTDSQASPTGTIGPKRASLRLLASRIRSSMTQAKDTWGSKIGDSLPNCNRCGRPIDPYHKIVTAGMQRFHEICPSKEESERGPRNCRYMVQKAQARIVLTFKCDKETKQPYSFIFDLDQQTKQDCLRMRNNADMTLVYIPDVTSHASLVRKIRVPETREFDLSVRYAYNFGFSNPATGTNLVPELDTEKKRVTVTKCCTTNGVLHTIEARFVYDEDEQIVSPEHLELRFSMMPGANPRLPTIVQQTTRRNSTVVRRLEQRAAAAAANAPPMQQATLDTRQSEVSSPVAISQPAQGEPSVEAPAVTSGAPALLCQ